MKTFDVSKDYKREDFTEFLTDFLPDDFEPAEEETYFEYTNIEEGYKLGTSESLNLDVFEFRTKSNRDPRVTLTKEVVSCMKKYGYNQNALVVFYSTESHNWRLSLITSDYEVVNGKVRPLYSNPRRFSFKLGEDGKIHTPTVMLFNKGQVKEHIENGKTLTAFEDLQNRFAIEVVGDEFFKEYKVFYEDFVQYITGNRYLPKAKDKTAIHPENEHLFNQFLELANNDYDTACKYVRDYIKKLMGRLVFLHFLQKKGWLGVEENSAWGTGNKNFLLDLYKSSAIQEQDDFLEKVLEPLFFGMLNTTETERESLFKKEEWNTELLKKFKKIPYLNGGLFESDSLDNLNIKFPKELFSNETAPDFERKYQDERPYPYTKCCGLLDFFARYNFTIDETDPADMEIGVEPEMLGKIFENLLEDNKDKGAFYTPKEIVQYMCRESLIAYLLTDSKIEETRIRNFVLTHNEKFSNDETTELLHKLETVKVCDPAVGSGAFPMGMMNELFACRFSLEAGENNEINKSDAARIKKDIVKENIYGVDIEKGAVDIARLRFWLAIIVDETTPIPLPNLDYKIMQGNSLLESYEGIDLTNISTVESLSGLGKNLLDEWEDPNDAWKLLKNAEIEGFAENLKEYFDTSDHSKKAELQNDIMDFIRRRITDKLDLQSVADRKLSLEMETRISTFKTQLKTLSQTPNDPEAIKAQKDLAKAEEQHNKLLKKIHESEEKQEKVASLTLNNSKFFLWHTWFNDVFNRTDDCNKNGFDIVIGNPPYGAKVSDTDKKYFKAHYKCAETDNKLGLKGSTDTFTVFIEMGHDMLSTGGNLAFIVPMSVTSSDAMISLHKKIESDCSEIRVSSYSNRPQQIFDAACVRTSIIMFKRDGKNLEHLFTTKLIRRNKNTTIQYLIDNLEFVDSVNLKTPGRYAKVGTKIEADTLTKCFAYGKNIGSYKSEKGKPFFYRSAGGRYWNVVANYSTTESSSEKSMNVDFTNLIGMFLSSSVFYFYQQIYTDGLNLKQSEIENFPLPDFTVIPLERKTALEKLYDEYLADIEKNANVRTSSDSSTYNVSTFKEYKIVKSYALVEKIDNEVCSLYGLTPEETNFIKNYELEARMVGAE